MATRYQPEQPSPSPRPPGPRRSRAAGGRGRSARAALRRDVPCTVAVLVGPEDFCAMRQYASFGFSDYRTYLRHVEELLRALRSRGLHVRVAVFDPAEFTAFCARHGLDPDTPVTRARYAADAAGPGAAVPYGGEPLDDLVHTALHGAERRRVHAAARAVVDAHGSGAVAYQQMHGKLTALVERAGPGEHHLVCSATVHGTPLLAAVHVRSTPGPRELPEDDAALFCAVLAAGLLSGGGGGVVLRTRPEPEGRDTVRGWAVRDGALRPLTAGEVFDAYCTDHRTGEPIAPEHGVDYEAGFPLDLPPSGHGPDDSGDAP